MIKLVVVYHSVRGHTARVAEAVAEGAASVSGCNVLLLAADAITERDWEALDSADAIIFGCPTYMGGVTAPFKHFIDSASKRWHQQRWKNKLAAGFTNSGSLCGDKLSSLQQIVLNAMQHSMIWVGTGLLPPSTKDTRPLGEQINRLGSSLGVMTQANDEPPEFSPPPGDITTAKLLGQRVAEITIQFVRGRV